MRRSSARRRRKRDFRSPALLLFGRSRRQLRCGPARWCVWHLEILLGDFANLEEAKRAVAEWYFGGSLIGQQAV